MNDHELFIHSYALNLRRAHEAIRKHDKLCKVLGNQGCNCSVQMGCKFNNWSLRPMCELCRDLKPADCPGCLDFAEVELRVMAALADEASDIHDEMYRDIGEPISE